MKNPYKSLALLTDLYQFNMAYAYYKTGIANRDAVFHLFFRRPPFKGGFTVSCGLDSLMQFVENFAFSKEDLQYLKSLTYPNGTCCFDDRFLDMLESMKLTVTIHAVPEGTVVFPYEPLVRVQGPLLQCQLLESPLLNLMNFPTLIATKAARVVLAAHPDPVVEFGLRRAQGIDGALTASRAAYIGGCTATSNVLAGKRFDIPVQGTHAHSWVMAFENEKEAFMAYAKAIPDNCVLLVDTYDSITGVKNAITVGKWLRAAGKQLVGIRLDSGDLAQLSIESRKLLDAVGFVDTHIVASNELDEVVISELKRQGAKISMWGVGTNLVTGKECSALDGVYKLSAIKENRGKWKYVLKLSEQLAKVSNPGILQIRRFIKNGLYVGDLIYDEQLGMHPPYENVDLFDPTKRLIIDSAAQSADLLVPIFKKGKKVYKDPHIVTIRQKVQQELTALPVGVKRFLNPHVYPVMMERHLNDLKVKLMKKVRKFV